MRSASRLRPSQLFLEQAAACDGRSPLYARLCRAFADDARAAALVAEQGEERWPALLLLGGLHWLVLAGRGSWDDVDAMLDGERDFLHEFVRTRSVQTNEVQRCYALLPGFLTIAREVGADELDLVELGPAAGFNLLWDRYRYHYDGGEWGRAEAPLTLTGDERGRVPRELLETRVRGRRRVGIDLDPVDVTDPERARLLEAWVWPDMTDRVQRLRAAMEVVRADPPELVRGDYLELLPDVLARRDRFTVVFETASRAYLTDEERRRLRDVVEEAATREPLAWLATTHPSEEGLQAFGLELRMWPGGEKRVVADMDYHGRWLDWRG